MTMKRAFLLCLILAASVNAQIKLEITSPRYSEFAQGGVSGLYMLQNNFGDFSVEWGLARLDAGAVQSTSFSNPRLSVALEIEKTKLEYFVYVPLTRYSNQARFFGMLGDPEDFQAFASDAVSLGGGISRQFDIENEIVLGYDVKLMPMIALKRTTLADRIEIVIPYNFSVVDVYGNFSMGAELGGNYFLTETNQSFNDNILAQFKALAGYRFGRLAVQFFIKLPVDKTTDAILRNTIGLTFSFQ